jgi:hypothetical protein
MYIINNKLIIIIKYVFTYGFGGGEVSERQVKRTERT